MAGVSTFTAEIGDAICERLANGESLRSICEGDDMPSRATVFKWLGDHATFSDQYARAREAQADVLADEIVAIADTVQLGVKTKIGPNGSETTEGDMIEHRRLQVDARKWVAAKLKPRKYGDKLQQEVSGPDGAPIEINSGDLARRLVFLLRKAEADGGASG